ncbi:hypothetical protein TSUD_103620 [Trifolium subterraneum]|uniref:Uncharacterized protein n=1 Tax=Trifolium subterraneum TaxID=3900 RepID=A0A2Z6NU49_TRISU|nr:hypothetical protein TSUD_103620 [Trifolium subterraneum]
MLIQELASPSASDVKQILGSVGVDAEDKGKDFAELIAGGGAVAISAAPGGGAAAAAPAA